MKTYHVTMHRIQQYVFAVYADTPEEAEHKAMDEARINCSPETTHANWETVHTEEQAI